MDLNDRINLRTFEKTNSFQLYKAILFALFLHALLWNNLTLPKTTTVAEVPEWINVNLTVGFEAEKEKSVINKNKKTITKKTYNRKETSSENRDKKENIKKEVPNKIATAFVTANAKPYIIDNPKPVYPNSARKRGMQGIVLLSVNISNKGFVTNVIVLSSSGFKLLDRSAIESVTKWRFLPAKKGGENISSQLEIPIRFILSE